MSQTEYNQKAEDVREGESKAEPVTDAPANAKSSKFSLLSTLAITAMTVFQGIKIIDLILPFFSGTQYSEIIRTNWGAAALAAIIGVPLFVFLLYTCIASWKMLRGDDSLISYDRLTSAPKGMSLLCTVKVVDAFVLVCIMILLFSGTVAKAGAGYAADLKNILDFYNWDKMGLWSTITAVIDGAVTKLNQPLTVLLRFIVMLLVLANAFVVMMAWKAIEHCRMDLATIKENPEITLNKKPPVVLPLVVGGLNAAGGLFLVIDMIVALVTKGTLGLGITGLVMLATSAYLICTALEFKAIPFTPILTEADIKTSAAEEAPLE